MAVIATYSIAGNDAGILAVAFPQVRVLRGPHFPPFIADKKLIVFSDEDPFTKYPDKDIIQVTTSATTPLDTRHGFLKFLASTGVKASNEQVERLLEMPEGDFWNEAKLATLFKRFPTVSHTNAVQQKGALYRLYDALFEDFAPVYKEYNLLKSSMTQDQILSGLMTMTQKAERVNRIGGISFKYRQMLRRNRRFNSLFN